MASEEPGPGQKVRRDASESQTDITIEIRWCPAHKGVPGKERTDEWAKLLTEKPDAHGVEWKQYSDQYGKQPTTSQIPCASQVGNLRNEKGDSL
jgi:ribonuclease HI